jgi:hypothetical protein
VHSQLSPADNHENRGAGRPALSGVPEIGGELKVVALTKPEDPVGNLNINLARYDEEPFLTRVADFAANTGASGKLYGEDCHIVRLI